MNIEFQINSLAYLTYEYIMKYIFVINILIGAS